MGTMMPSPTTAPTEIAIRSAGLPALPGVEPRELRTRDDAHDYLAEVARARRAVEAKHKPIKAEAKALHDKACADERDELAPFARAETILRDAIAAWDREQERIKAEEHRRLVAEERMRIEAAAIREAEAIEANAAKMREEAEAFAAFGADEAAADLRAAAEDAEDRAVAVLIQAETAPAPVVIPVPLEKPKGTREKWRANVVDPKAFLEAVAAGRLGPVAIEKAVAAALPKANELAVSQRSAMRFPGVEPVCDRTVTAGR